MDASDWDTFLERASYHMEILHHDGQGRGVQSRGQSQGPSQLEAANEEILHHGGCSLEEASHNLGRQLHQLNSFQRLVSEGSSMLVEGAVKDKETAMRHKQRASAHFKNQSWVNAVEEYGHALRFLPSEDKIKASLIYCNRSLCYSKLASTERKPRRHFVSYSAEDLASSLENLKLSLLDAKSALVLNPSSHKAFYLSAKARSQIYVKIAMGAGSSPVEEDEANRHLSMAKRDARRALDLAQLTGLDQSKVHEISLLAQVCDAYNPRIPAASQSDTDPLEEQANEPWASPPSFKSPLIEIIEVVDEGDQGRWREPRVGTVGKHLRATKEGISTPMDIFSEGPLASCLHKSEWLKRCHCCGLPINRQEKEEQVHSAGSRRESPPRLIPCPNCPLVVYCSHQCQLNDPFHKPHTKLTNGQLQRASVECGVPWARLVKKEVLLASRLSSVANSAVDDLMSHESMFEEESNVSLFAQRVMDAHLVVSCQYQVSKQRGESIHGLPRAWQVFQCLGKVAINGISLRPCISGSSTSLSEGNEDNSYHMRTGILCYGLGVFPTVSYLNHSCKPNVLVRFEGVRCVGRATERVESNTSLCITYGPEEDLIGMAGGNIRSFVMDNLEEQYRFECQCCICSAWPSFNQPGHDELYDYYEEDTEILGRIESKVEKLRSMHRSSQTSLADLVTQYEAYCHETSDALCSLMIDPNDGEEAYMSISRLNSLGEAHHSIGTLHLLQARALQERLDQDKSDQGQLSDPLMMVKVVAMKGARAFEESIEKQRQSRALVFSALRIQEDEVACQVATQRLDHLECLSLAVWALSAFIDQAQEDDQEPLEEEMEVLWPRFESASADARDSLCSFFGDGESMALVERCTRGWRLVARQKER